MSCHFQNEDPLAVIDYMKSCMKLKPPDCSFFTEGGDEIPIHRELFSQTEIMRNIAKSHNCCCSKIEVIFPEVSIEELDLIVEFLYSGQISCTSPIISAKVFSNLEKFLGFSKISNHKPVDAEKEDIPIKSLDMHSTSLTNIISL